MSEQFMRQLRLTFGKYGENGKQTTQLRVTFNIQKSKKADVNTAQILIYNLNPDSRALINDTDIFISVETKWKSESQWSVICSGDVLDVSTRKRGVDFITEVNIGDGFKDLRSSTISKSYPAGASIKTVIKDLANSFKRIDGKKLVLDAISDTKQLITGGTFSGSAADELEKILKPYNLVPRIQNNDLIIEEELKTSETEAFVISPTSGLIGSPQNKTLTINSVEQKGISFEALLNPKIDISSIVDVQSKFINGQYIVYNLNYIGDNQQGDWKIVAECVERS